MDRSKNGYNFDYTLVNHIEDSGIRYYCHKYILYGKRYDISHDPIINKLEREKTLPAEMARRNRSLILRSVVQFRGTGSIVVSPPPPQGEKAVPQENSSRCHTFVYESQLIEPKIKSVVEKDYLAWIKEYTIERDNWKIVDIDNFMQGNSYFHKIVKDDSANDKPPKDENKPKMKVTEKIAEELIERMRREMNPSATAPKQTTTGSEPAKTPKPKEKNAKNQLLNEWPKKREKVRRPS